MTTQTRTTNEKRIRHIRVADDMWIAASQKANAEGIKISELIRVLLRDYLRTP